jgi:hypothetical protein
MSRLKLPKEHVAGGVPLKIKYGSNVGGSFSFPDGEIVIDQEDILQTKIEALLHECAESSMHSHRVRYGAQKEEYVFVFDHRTFCVLCSELAGTVLKLLKANGYKESKDEDSN